MTIWLLAILVLASVAALGYQQGAIRASISFFGIILAALLAPLAGKIFKPLLGWSASPIRSGSGCCRRCSASSWCWRWSRSSRFLRASKGGCLLQI
jgi:hypothetical protein